MNSSLGLLSMFTKETCSTSIFSNSTPQNTSLEKEEMKQALNGLKAQVVDFGERTKNMFSCKDGQVQQLWDNRVEKVKTELVECEKLADISLKEKKQFSKDLNTLNKACKFKLDVLNAIDGNNEIETKQKLTHLDNVIKKFMEEHDQNFRLFKDVVGKLKNLKNKIDEQDSILAEGSGDTKRVLDNVMFRVKKVVPDYVISTALENSFIKDNERIIKYNELKKEWLESLIHYNTVEDHIQSSTITLKTLPKIAGFCDMLKMPKEYFSSLNTSFEKISPNKVSAGFKEKYQKDNIRSVENYQTEVEKEGLFQRDLNGFLKDIRAYKEHLESLGGAQQIIEKLNESKNLFLPIINKKLNEISEEIQSINERNHETLNFVDNDMAIQLKKQKQDSIESLHLLRKEIEQQWNQFCLDLNALNHQKTIFNAFRSITEKMGWCFILAESVQGNLRNCRKTINDRNIHYGLFDQKLNDYHKLCKLVKNSNLANLKDSVESLDVSSIQMPVELDASNYYIFSDSVAYMSGVQQDSNLYFANSHITLKDEYEETRKLKETIFIVHPSIGQTSNLEVIAKTIGLVWPEDSEDTKAKILQSFNDQRIAFANELITLKENAREAYENILPNICTIAANEVNREGTTLMEAEDIYDQCFTRAYYAQNPVVNLLQHGGHALMNNIWGQKDNKQSLFEFKPVLSPFDQKFKLESLQNLS